MCIHCKAIVILGFFIIIIILPLFERLLRGDRYTFDCSVFTDQSELGGMVDL